MHVDKSDFLRLPPEVIEGELHKILLRHHLPEAKARKCASVFTNNSVDGVYTHGVNRFARFIDYVRKGIIHVDQDPALVSKTAAIETWDGGSGIGITNALACTERAIEISREFGIGCVALANTNHWMRAGTYARDAATSGFVFICWTNTIANTPAWGASDAHLGNNPLAIGVPFKEDAIVLDMAMSQYSYGALEFYKMKGEMLPLPGGFDINGNLTTDPQAILESRRMLPIGYWKGSGLSLLLDILATILSSGLSVPEISKEPVETRLSQVFIAFNMKALPHMKRIPQLIEGIINDLHHSVPDHNGKAIRYPGEGALNTRKENQALGVPVLRNVWEEIVML